MGIDIREHGGPFGGGKYRKNSLIPFYNLQPSNPPSKGLLQYGSSYNQSIEFKYYDKYNNEFVFTQYNGSSSTIYFVDADTYVTKVSKNVTLNSEYIKFAIRRNSNIYYVKQNGSYGRMYKIAETGSTFTQILVGELTTIYSPNFFFESANVISFYDNYDKYVKRIDFSTEKLINKFYAFLGFGNVYFDSNGYWYVPDNNTKTVVYDKNGNVVRTSAQYAIPNNVTTFHQESGRILQITVPGSRQTVSLYDATNFSFITSYQLSEKMAQYAPYAIFQSNGYICLNDGYIGVWYLYELNPDGTLKHTDYSGQYALGTTGSTSDAYYFYFGDEHFIIWETPWFKAGTLNYKLLN